jgi:hypothetical protein
VAGFLCFEMHIRKCDFCEFRAEYDLWPDGSIVYRGFAACVDCLEDPGVARFFELIHFAKVMEKEFELAYG